MSRRFSDTARHVALVGLLFVTAGCLAPVGTEVDDSRAVASQVESRYETLNRFEATLVRNLTVGNQTNVTRATVTFEKGRYLRIVHHTGPNAGSATVVEDPTPERLVGAETTDASADAASIYGAIAADVVRQNRVVYRGIETQDDRRVAVFSIVPSRNRSTTAPGPRLTDRRVWLDTERMVPVQIRSTVTVDGQTVVETIRFENVSLRAPATAAGAVPGGAAT